jgi:hypothetical protein
METSMEARPETNLETTLVDDGMSAMSQTKKRGGDPMKKITAPVAIVILIIAIVAVAFSFKQNFVNTDHPPTGPPTGGAMAEFKKH